MPRFRKKPVEIEARLYDPDAVEPQLLAAWSGGTVRTALAKPTDAGTVTAYIDIPTLEGVMTANPGDWIIRGVKGEFYPCKPEIFSATYDPAETPTPSSSTTSAPSTETPTETTEEPS